MLQMLPNMMIIMNPMEFAFSIHAPSQSPAAPDAERIPNTISTLPNMLHNVLMVTSYENASVPAHTLGHSGLRHATLITLACTPCF